MTEQIKQLRYRTNFVKNVPEKIVNPSEDVGWIDVIEQIGGGAVIMPSTKVKNFWGLVYERYLKTDEEFSVVCGEKEGEYYMLQEDGSIMPFEKIMKILFG